MLQEPETGKHHVSFYCAHHPSPHLLNDHTIYNSFVGTVLAGLAIYGEKELDRIIDVAQRVAVLSLQTHSSISEKLNAGLLKLD